MKRWAPALLALSAVPLTAGTLRLIQLAGGPAVIPADQRFAGDLLYLLRLVFGSGVLAGDCAKGAAWVINLAVAEWILRHRAPSTRPRRAAALA